MFTPFSGRYWSLLRRQSGAETIGYSAEGNKNSQHAVDPCLHCLVLSVLSPCSTPLDVRSLRNVKAECSCVQLGLYNNTKQ